MASGEFRQSGMTAWARCSSRISRSYTGSVISFRQRTPMASYAIPALDASLAVRNTSSASFMLATEDWSSTMSGILSNASAAKNPRG